MRRWRLWLARWLLRGLPWNVVPAPSITAEEMRQGGVSVTLTVHNARFKESER